MMFFLDNYAHPENIPCFYTISRVAGPGAPSALDDTYPGCACSGHCSATCSCSKNCYVLLDGQKYLNGNVFNKEEPFLMFECHDECVCFNEVSGIDLETSEQSLMHDDICPNRWLQFGPITGLEIVSTAGRGLGLNCKKPIKRNTFICEYAGEVIDLKEANRRCHQNFTNNMPNYVFVLREHFASNEIITCIDPSEFGNIGRYINHSCDPNAAILPVRIGSPVPYLGVFAIKDIPQGEEICFDYGNEGLSLTPCKCGSISCRKWLPGTGNGR